MALRWPDDNNETVQVDDVRALRSWFEANHATARGAWIWFWKAASARRSITWSEMVDVLLCFGWIDTKIQPIDADSYVQYVTHRKVGSAWSKVNKAKVVALEAQGLMTPAGRAVIDRAKADGSWTLLDATEDRIVPEDLATAFGAAPAAQVFYESLSPWQQSAVLRRIYASKRAPTRAKWVAESVRRLAAGDKPPY